MGTRLSGSRLPIAKHCSWAFREDVSYPAEPESLRGDANDGNRKHDYFAEYIDTGNFPPLSGLDKVYASVVRQWWEKLNRGHNEQGWRAEVSYALAAGRQSARRLGYHLNRNYGVLDNSELPLTVDYEGIENGIYTVGDFKTGFGAHVDAPENNLQLLAGACAGAMVADAEGRISSMGAKIEIIHLDEETTYPRIYIASPFVLLRALQDIEVIQNGIANATAIPGDHCSFCPARGACPATTDLVDKACATREYPIERRAIWTTAHVSDENDALLVDELAAVKKAIEAVDAALKERHKNNPLKLRDGKLYKMILVHQNRFSKEKAAEILGSRISECIEPVEYERFSRVKA